MKAISFACSVTLLSLFVGGCGGTDSSHSSRKTDSSLTGLSEDRTDSNGVDDEAADAPRANPLEPLVISDKNSWIRIETPALLDAKALETVNAMGVALQSLGEAVEAQGFEQPTTHYTTLNGHVVDISGYQGFRLSDDLGHLAASFYHSGGWEQNDENYPGKLPDPPYLWGEYAVPRTQDTPLQISPPSNLTTIALHVGLPESSPPQDERDDSSGRVIVPMTLSSPCGAVDAQFEFRHENATARQWNASLYIEGDKIPLTLQGRTTKTQSESEDILLGFDTEGLLNTGSQQYLLLSSTNLASHLPADGCIVSEGKEWRISIIMKRNDVLLLGEQYPFNFVTYPNTLYGEITLNGISLSGQTVYANYALDYSIEIGFATVYSKQPNQGNYLFTYNPLDLGIVGEGFFVLAPESIERRYSYSRLGDFSFDDDGLIVNTQGDRLQGYPVDGDGNVVSTAPDTMTSLRLPETEGPAKATSKVSMQFTTSAAHLALDVIVFDPNQSNSYTMATSLYVYDGVGEAHIAAFYLLRDSIGDNQWALYCVIDGRIVPFDDGMGAPVPYASFAFDDQGQIDPDSLVPAVFRTLSATSSGQSIEIDIAGSNIDYSGNSGFFVTALEQDGFGPGSYIGFYVNDAGLVSVSLDNGQTITLGKVELATFPHPQGLTPIGNSAWEPSAESGNAQLGEAGTAGFGYIHSGVLEVPWLP